MTAHTPTETQPNNRNITPWLIAGLLLALVAGIFIGRRGASPVPAPPATAAAPEETEDHSLVRFEPASLKLADLGIETARYTRPASRLPVTGAVEPNLGGVVKITPRVAGKVTKVSATVGDTVRTGQALAVIASTELAEAQAAYKQASARVAAANSSLGRQKRLAGLGAFGRPQVEEARGRAVESSGATRTARNEVAAGRSEIAEATSELAALRAALSQAKTQADVSDSRFARADALLKEELIARQDWEQARADARSAKADVDAAAANVAKGEAKVRTAQSHLKVAEAALAAAEAQSRIAGQALKREEAVYKGGYVTSKEILDAETALQEAKLARDAAADQIRLLGGSPGGGNHVAVTAPQGGRVTERAVTLGETVTPEQALFTVTNLETVWVQLNVYPKDMATIQTGQAVEITPDAAPGRIFTGTVSYIGDTVDETTRTVKVRCEIPNAGRLLKPSTFVHGAILGSSRAAVLTVPEAAVQKMGGESVVFVASDTAGEFETRPVTTGEKFGDAVTVTAGLKPGERVVVRNAFVVKAQAMKHELAEDH